MVNHRRELEGQDCEVLKAKALKVLVDLARRKKEIAYLPLVRKIGLKSTLPQHSTISEILEEIATEEHREGRGMLTALVVHKGGDHMPGKGFFNLARELGHKFGDDEDFWVQEREKVFAAWAK